MLNAPAPTDDSDLGQLYAAAYRPLFGRDEAHVEAWPAALAIGQELPTLPLWLEADLAVPVDLEESYRAVCETLRISDA